MTEQYAIPRRRRFFVFLFLTILWCAVIFLLSGENGGESSGLSERILEMLRRLPIFSAWKVDGSFLIRKTAHVTEYLILSMLLFFTVREEIRRRNRPVLTGSFYPRLVILPAGLTYVWAALDEFHQTFVPGRCGTVTDTGIDSIGILLGTAVSWLILQISYHRSLNRETIG